MTHRPAADSNRHPLYRSFRARPAADRSRSRRSRRSAAARSCRSRTSGTRRSRACRSPANSAAVDQPHRSDRHDASGLRHGLGGGADRHPLRRGAERPGDAADRLRLARRLAGRERRRALPDPAEPADRGRRRSRPNQGDRHILVVRQGACILYELYHSWKEGDFNGEFTCSVPGATPGWCGLSGAVYDLASNALRPDGWTSADAAGLPIFPGLVRYDEVETGEIRHALRFTVDISRTSYVWPARHQAGSTSNVDAPPMGLRLRMKAALRPRGLYAARPHDPSGAQEVRHDGRRQRHRLVPERRPRSALGRRRAAA